MKISVIESSDETVFETLIATNLTLMVNELLKLISMRSSETIPPENKATLSILKGSQHDSLAVIPPGSTFSLRVFRRFSRRSSAG